MMIAGLLNSSNGSCPSTCAGVSARAALKPSFSKRACTISERGGAHRLEFRVQLACVRMQQAEELDSELPSLSQERIGIDVGAFPVTLGIGNDRN